MVHVLQRSFPANSHIPRGPGRKKAINLELNVWIGYALQTSRNIPHKVMVEDLPVKTMSSNHNPFYLPFMIAVYKNYQPNKLMKHFHWQIKKNIGLTRWDVERCLLNLILIRLREKIWQSLSGAENFVQIFNQPTIEKEIFVVFHPCFPFLIAIINLISPQFFLQLFFLNDFFFIISHIPYTLHLFHTYLFEVVEI